MQKLGCMMWQDTIMAESWQSHVMSKAVYIVRMMASITINMTVCTTVCMTAFMAVCMQELGYIMWNDEFLGGEPPVWEGGAHAKGVLGLGLTQGFYLLHSVPKFPAPASVNCSKASGNGTYTGIALVSQTQSFVCNACHMTDDTSCENNWHADALMKSAYLWPLLQS